MERWQQSLDQWLTTPPENDYDDVQAGKCDHCRTTLYHGQDVYYDSRDGGFTFCDKECFKEWLFNHIEEEIDYYIELLEDNKDTYTEVIVADFSEEDCYDGVDREEDL